MRFRTAITSRPRLTVALCIVAGFITTIFVAWCLSLSGFVSKAFEEKMGRDRRPERGEGTGVIGLDVESRTGSREIFGWVDRDTSLTFPHDISEAPSQWRELALPWLTGERAWADSDRFESRAVRAYGFPMLALWRCTDYSFERRGGADLLKWKAELGARTSRWLKYLPFFGRPVDDELVPVRPLRRGVVIDTVVYAAAWYGVVVFCRWGGWRVVRVVILCLLLAIPTTIGVAWGDSLSSRQMTIENPADVRVQEGGTSIAYRFGWPWRSMWDEEVLTNAPSATGRALIWQMFGSPNARPAPPPVLVGAWHISIAESMGAPNPTVPLRPCWGGFALDVAAWGGAWRLLILSFIGARRLRRRWRGLCPKCTYDLRGDLAGGCPECGWGRAGKSVQECRGGSASPAPPPGKDAGGAQ